MRLKLIACEVLYREISAVAAVSRNTVDVEFLPQGLHNKGAKGMLAELQSAVDRADPRGYEAIVLGYGICGNGLVGLAAGKTGLVIPRAHDCITFFLGSRGRYHDYFYGHPGTYFETTGWIERGGGECCENQLCSGNPAGLSIDRGELVRKFGEENARYVIETLTGHTTRYETLAFIRMGVEPDGSMEEMVKRTAAERGLKFEGVEGDMALIRSMVEGEWNDKDFLIVPPGWVVAPRYDENIIKAVPAE